MNFFFFLRRRYIFGGESGVKALLVLASHAHTHTHPPTRTRTHKLAHTRTFSVSLPLSRTHSHVCTEWSKVRPKNGAGQM